MFFVGIAVGLLVGWNCFPQPEFVRVKFEACLAWFNSKKN